MSRLFNSRKSENGQALILIVLSFVILLGFTALAIDGGMVYSDRRFAQNASDASSLAGGGNAAMVLENEHITYANWTCAVSSAPNSVDIQAAMAAARTAAINRALDNGFIIDTTTADYNGVRTDCGVFNNGAWIEKYLDVTTYISKTTPTSFAHFVYSGPLQNRVEAVTRVRPRAALAFGNSVVALNPTLDCSGQQNGVLFSGTNEVNIQGGGIYSNGCLRGNSNSLDVDVLDGTIVHAGQLLYGHEGTFSPTPVPADGTALPDYSLIFAKPNCSLLTNGSPSDPDRSFRNHATGTIPPGNYSSIRQTGNVVLEGGGLYCLYGDWEVGNNSLEVAPRTIGSNTYNGITIYMVSGNFTVTSSPPGSYIRIAAPPDTPDPSPAIPGLLFYMDDNNVGNITLIGNSASTFVGTIYAPNGNVRISGTGDVVTFNTQLIGYNVEIGGNALLDVNFDEDTSYMSPTGMELYR